jgi:hypothetical protein
MGGKDATEEAERSGVDMGMALYSHPGATDGRRDLEPGPVTDQTPRQDPARELTDALGSVKIAVDKLRSRAEIAVPLLRNHSPGAAKAVERLLAALGKLEPDVIQLLERLESKTDPTRWAMNKEGPER